MRSKSCDIFCTVVDNYGDIGVCWRLARQLANEHGISVRLWVDDLRSFGKLCPELDTALDEQRCRGVEVWRWAQSSGVNVSGVFPHPHPSPDGRRALLPSPDGGGTEGGGVADLVIEAFACELPQAYVEAMAAREHKPVWINLEYLSAEGWVEGCHKLPSPHPSLPLTKYFFFPGFTEKTGGLLLERDLLAQRDAFQSDAAQQRAFWRSIGVEMPAAATLKVSLFGYENAALHGLFDAWANGSQSVLCLVPEGCILPQVEQYFEDAGRDLSRQGGCVGMNPGLHHYLFGNLHVCVLPFVEQERYDEMLWACDINFVRGEDSCARAQWAARPFVWQIYPQHDGVHLEKLGALQVRYTAGLPPEAALAVQNLWLAWNGGQDIAVAWQRFAAQREVLTRHGVEWARRLGSNNLALNLLDFFRQVA